MKGLNCERLLLDRSNLRLLRKLLRLLREKLRLLLLLSVVDLDLILQQIVRSLSLKS